MSAKIELHVTWNGIKIAKLQIDDLPWWLSTIIAVIPKGTICICMSRNFDRETEQVKKIFKPRVPITKM